MIDGGAINAFIIHLLGYVFLYRQGFFTANKRVKLLIGAAVLAAAIGSQFRLGYIIFTRHLIQFVDFTSIIVVAGFAFSPEINNPAASSGVCCFGKVFASGFNTADIWSDLIAPRLPRASGFLGIKPFAYNQKITETEAGYDSAAAE